MRALLATIVTLALVLTASAANVFAQARPLPPYQVVVHASNPVTSLDRSFVEDAFLKKITRWPNDEVIRPADLTPNSPVRRRFSERVIHRSVEMVKTYWQQRIFSGRDVPPPEFGSDEEVIAYVRKHDGAIGYVSGSADVKGLKTVPVR